jgi:hypothetical protein
MPESRHTRGGRRRTRTQRQRAPEQRPAPSPRWVGATGLGLVSGGAAVLLLGNLPVIADLTRDLPALGSNWTLVVGILLVTAGFVLLMRWR